MSVLRLLTFNICHTASLGMPASLGLIEVAKLIVETDCDVCAIQEADGNGCTTCSDHGVCQEFKQEVMMDLFCILGDSPEGDRWQVSLETCILSRVDVEFETDRDLIGRSHGSVKLTTASGGSLWVYNVHLNWEAQPQIALHHSGGVITPDMIATEWQNRGLETMTLINSSSRKLNDSNGVILMGDFNTMSHLDLPQSNKAQLAWPISSALQQAGFVDAYRTVHPNPVKSPGLTWYVPLPKYNMSKEIHGRLDYVFINGPKVQVLDAKVIYRPPWPSDHKALLVTVQLNT